jgi:hypothetical protein
MSIELPPYMSSLITMLRRAVPNQIAHDLASVQPMAPEAGLLFRVKCRMTRMRCSWRGKTMVYYRSVYEVV